MDKSLNKEISAIIQKFEDIKQEADLKIETLASLQKKIADTPSFVKKLKHFLFSDALEGKKVTNKSSAFRGKMSSSSDEKSNDEGLILGVMNAMVSDSASKSSAYHGKRGVMNAMVSDSPSKSSAYHGKRGVKQESLMEALTSFLDQQVV